MSDPVLDSDLLFHNTDQNKSGEGKKEVPELLRLDNDVWPHSRVLPVLLLYRNYHRRLKEGIWPVPETSGSEQTKLHVQNVVMLEYWNLNWLLSTVSKETHTKF